MHFNIELQHNSDIRKFSSLKMKDVVFSDHQLPSNQLKAAQSSLVSNSDHSWNFSIRTYRKKTHTRKKGEDLSLIFKLNFISN